MREFAFALIPILSLAALPVAQKREDVLVAKVYKGSQGRTMPYRLYVPENYDKQKKYPLARWGFRFSIRINIDTRKAEINCRELRA